MSLINRTIQLIVFIIFRVTVEAVICFHCHSELGTCNSGVCEGIVCIKMETSNRDNERRTVQKGCGKKYEESGCQQSTFGSKWTSRCVCDEMMCNTDENLAAANLEMTSSTFSIIVLSSVQILLISLVFVFAIASYPFIIINTVCFIFFCHVCFGNSIICNNVK